MIEKGSDGLSWGNLKVVVMAGKDMLSFVPIHLSELDRSDNLKPWLESFAGTNTEFLSPEQWLTRGHNLDETNWEVNYDGMKLLMLKKGTFIWTPPPCAGEAAVEALRRAIHKRKDSHHIFIIPRLMEPTWRKHLHKAADLIVSLKPGHKDWPNHMHEPLTIAFIFPFIRHKPWQLRGSIQILALGRALSGVWMGNPGSERLIFPELWSYQVRLENMLKKLACKLLCSKQVNFVSHINSRKRQGGEVEKEERRTKMPACKKGRYSVRTFPM